MSLQNIHYIVFDLNGTLVSENYLRYDTVFEDVLHCQRRDRGLTIDDLRTVSRGRMSLNQMITRIYLTDNAEFISHQFVYLQASRITLRKQALAILKFLQRRYPLLLCSDTTGIAKAVVKNLDLVRYFMKIFYSCDVGYLKSEEKFWTLFQSWFPQASPKEFLVVGDNSRADVLNPVRLGMHTIKIDNPLTLSLDYREASFPSDEEQPAYHIRELAELLPLLNL